MKTPTLLHFSFSQMLDILRANCNARLLWRAQRKVEAYRGRAVLRAAKRALDQAAVEVVGTGLRPLHDERFLLVSFAATIPRTDKERAF